MPFQIQNFSRVSKSANEEINNIQDVVNVDSNGNRLLIGVGGCFREYNYFSKTYSGGIPGGAAATASGDSQGAIYQVSYFNAVASDLQVGDLINVYSYADNSYAVYAVLTTITQANPNGNVTLGMVKNAKSVIYISPAQILALNATPVVMVNGGNNYLVSVNNVCFTIASSSVAYAGGAPVFLNYNGGGNALTGTTSVPAAFFTGGVNGLVTANGVAPAAANANQNIVLTTATAFTGAAGVKPMFVSIDYTVYPFF
jgi:hypothetical protein